jgi:hypothetical protein
MYQALKTTGALLRICDTDTETHFWNPNPVIHWNAYFFSYTFPTNYSLDEDSSDIKFLENRFALLLPLNY